MAKRKYQKSAEQRKKEIDELTDMRNKEVENFFVSEDQLQQYLDFMAKFYDYSFRNSILIQKQFQGAQAVGSFKFWKDKGFPVQKGEKGIKILAPVTYKTFERERNNKTYTTPLKYATEEEKEKIDKGVIPTEEHLTYRIGYVFDISQTSAKESDLPKIFPNKWLDGTVNDYELMYNSLEVLAKQMNVEILNEPLNELGVAKGAYVEYQVLENGEMKDKKGIELNPRNSEINNIKTLIHELAHAKLHHSNTENAKTLNHNEKEFQAEMTAYTVCSHFNIDTSDYSLQYLHTYTKDHEKIKDKMALLQEVKDTAHEFITHIENDLVKEQELEKSITNANEYDKQLQQTYGDIDVIFDKQITPIGELSLDDFQNYFHDQHDRNVLAQFEDMDKSEVIQAFNSLEENWSKQHLNIKMVDDALTEPHAYVVWSETSINHSLQSVKSMDKELAKQNLQSFNSAGYDKTRINFVIPSEDSITVNRIDRVDLGDGHYFNLENHIQNAQPHLLKHLPENQNYLNDIYSKETVRKTLQNIYTNHLESITKHNSDQFEVDISKSNLQAIERFSTKNEILTDAELKEVKEYTEQEFNEQHEYQKTANKVINLKGHYEEYQKLLIAENTGDITEEKLTERIQVENKYVEAKQTLIDDGIDKGIIEKMEKDVQRDYQPKQHDKHQENVTSMKQFKQNQQGLSM